MCVLRLKYTKVISLQSKLHAVLYIQYISEFCISHSHGSFYLCRYLWYTCVSLANSQIPFLFEFKHFVLSATYVVCFAPLQRRDISLQSSLSSVLCIATLR